MNVTGIVDIVVQVKLRRVATPYSIRQPNARNQDMNVVVVNVLGVYIGTECRSGGNRRGAEVKFVAFELRVCFQIILLERLGVTGNSR